MRPTLIPRTTLGKLLIIAALFAMMAQQRTVGIAVGFLLVGVWIFVMLVDVNDSIRRETGQT